MADTSAEKLQNMNIQDFDGSEFDPFAPQNKMANMNNGEQTVDLLGECLENGQMTNGGDKQVSFDQEASDKHVSFDHEAGIGLPDPSYISQGQGQVSGFEGQKNEGYQRHMSEGEILGFQNKYGESNTTGQYEYTSDSEEDSNNLIDIQVSGVDSHPQSQGQTVGGNVGAYSSHDPSQNYDQYVENDYVEDNNEGDDDEKFDGPVDYDNDEIDPDSWHPEMDPDRLRRSRSPERSVSPYVRSESAGDVDSDMISSPSEMSHPEPFSAPVGGASERETFIPNLEGVETSDLISQGSQQISSEETESIDSRSETEGTPRRRRIPKPKVKKPLELPPWNDNVVIPKLPRMKPTLIGKHADLPPPSPPMLHRPRTAPARHNAKDASSDSGVEEEAKSPRKSSGEVKKKYGTDTKNERYKPGGGNIQVFSQKIVDTRSVTPRTDSSIPKSILSPRMSPSKEKAPLTPKAPTPNTKHVQSKIGSLNNVKHSPGGGNVKVLSTKVDFSSVHSKVGSKDKLDHKPKGGDKKILDQKVEIKAQSKVGSTANLKHKPGGGDKKIETQKVEFKESARSKVGSMDKVKHKPGGGDIKILDEKVDFSNTAKPKVGSMAKVKHQPGGGDKKIETQKLNFKETAKARTDTGASTGERRNSHDHPRSGSVTSSQEGSVQE